MFTNDASKVEQALEDINNMLERDGERYILNLFYIKAQLLFRLHRHTEALEALNKTQFNHDVQRAALFILTGKDKEAQIILDNFLASYIESINTEVDDIEETHIGILVLVSHLLERSFGDILKDNTNPDLDVTMLYEWMENFDGFSREGILESMWPPGISVE